MKTIYYFTLLISLLLLQGCAQIVAPTGGEIDETPPQLDSLGTIPLNYSTQFDGDKIALTFDEYFVLKNPKSSVFFSPSLENDPEYITKGRTLTILLNNKLKENTTYTINFGDAISDYTVGNKIPDFKYVFSTGDFIDSMKTTGKVIDAFTGKPKENVIVMLYDDFTDSVVSKSKPVYYSLTNKEGNYTLDFIKEGTYKLVALMDENRNFLYDLPNEQIGSSDSLLTLVADTNKTIASNSVISLYTKDYKKQAIVTKKYAYPGKLTLTFTKPIKSYALSFVDSIPLTFGLSEMNDNRDSLILWNPNLDNKKANIEVKFDTMTEIIKVYPFKIPAINLGIKALPTDRSLDTDAPLLIEFDRPITSYQSQSISILSDTQKIAVDSITFSLKTLKIYFPKLAEKNYSYSIMPDAISDVYGGNNNDTIKGTVTIQKKNYYGSFILKLKPKNNKATYILTLMNEQGKEISTKLAIGQKDIKFEKLAPGKYQIKAIEDRNSNGKWDTGDYYKNLKPEAVFYFPAPIEIRSNWDVAESWEI